MPGTSIAAKDYIYIKLKMLVNKTFDGVFFRGAMPVFRHNADSIYIKEKARMIFNDKEFEL